MTAFGLPPPRVHGSPFFAPVKTISAAVSSTTLQAERRQAWSEGYETGYRAGRMITDIGVTYGDDQPKKIIGDNKMTMQKICVETAKKHGVSVAQMKGHRRHHAVVLARHEFFWRACEETGNTLPAIGTFLNKDHTSVMNGVKRHTERLAP